MVDILDNKTGKKTGEIVSKQEAHKKGIWHGAIHIWIISKDYKKILLQKRCPLKNLFPNMWDISVGGHVSSGEEALVSAHRELEEELGLKAGDYNFEYVDTIKEEFVDRDLLSKEFVTIYKIVDDIIVENLVLQKEEVSEAKWFTKKELNDLSSSNKVIPHIEEFNLILQIMED